MPITISDEIIAQSSLNEEEFRAEMALLLYQAGLLTLGKARELSGLNAIAFQQFLGARKIEVPYSEENFEADYRLSKTIKLPV